MSIKMAYLLLAHKEPEQLNSFINQLLSYGSCDIYVHVDKKSKWMIQDIIKSPHVHIYSVYDVRWGSFEIIKAAVYLMKTAINSGEDYSHYYFGSGQDLMVKDGFYPYLEKNRDKVFLKIVREITNNRRASSLHKVKWPRVLMIRNDWHIYRFIRIAIQALCFLGINLLPNKKTIEKGVKVYEGHTWFIAPAEVIHYIIEYLDEHKQFMEYWEDSLASDLMFFQTIIMNSKFKNSVEDELMLVKFGKTFGTRNHPLDIKLDDEEYIDNHRVFFARKFDYADKKVYDYYIKKVQNAL